MRPDISDDDLMAMGKFVGLPEKGMGRLVGLIRHVDGEVRVQGLCGWELRANPALPPGQMRWINGVLEVATLLEADAKAARHE